MLIKLRYFFAIQDYTLQPFFFALYLPTIMVVVAQLVRAPDCGSGGRGFETHLPPKKAS